MLLYSNYVYYSLSKQQKHVRVANSQVDLFDLMENLQYIVVDMMEMYEVFFLF